MKRVVVTEKDVLKPLAVLMSLNFAILLSWTLVDPMVFVRVYEDELLTSYGRCISQGTQWKWFISTLGVLNFFALVIVNVQAYKAQGINDELAESKYIGLATLSMLQITIVGIPLLVIVYNDPSAYFFVWCGIIFIVCTTILLLMFVPKIKRWKTWSAKKNKRKLSQGGSIQNSGSVGGAVSDTSKYLASQGSVAETGSNVGGTDSDIKRQTPSLRSPADAESNVGSTKSVSFADKQSEITHHEQLDELKSLIVERHNIDITPIILEIEGAGGIIPLNTANE
jgi:hypothetical protein